MIYVAGMSPPQMATFIAVSLFDKFSVRVFPQPFLESSPQRGAVIGNDFAARSHLRRILSCCLFLSSIEATSPRGRPTRFQAGRQRLCFFDVTASPPWLQGIRLYFFFAA